MDQFDKELLEATHQGSEHWLSERIGRFTASEIHRLMGEPRNKADKWSEGAWTYILEKVAEEITGMEKFTPDTYAMAWGKENEPIARDLFQKAVGASKIEVPGFKPYEYEGKIIGGASPDGIAHFDVGDEVIPGYGCEIKCPSNPAIHISYLLIESAVYMKKHHKDHYWQCQMGMLCAGLDSWKFVSYQPKVKGLELFRFPLTRNDADLDQLKEKVIAAWNEKEEIKAKLLKL